MSALTLLGYISLAIALQLAVAIALAAHRRRKAGRDRRVHEPVARPSAPPLAWAGLRPFRVVHRTFEDEARGVCSFHLKPLDSLPLPGFKAGQFITVSLQMSDARHRPKTVTRCYSLSGKPGDDHLRISVKRAPAPESMPDAPPGLVSNHLHDNVAVGDVIALKAPSGQFHIDAGSNDPVVLIAGGIGLTPLLSMLLWCIEHQPARTIHLFCGARNAREQAFRPVLESLAKQHALLHLNFVRSSPSAEEAPGIDYQHRGYVDADLLRRTLPFGRHVFYVCGPPAMMASLVPGLLAWGVDPADVHYEAFGPASVASGPSPVGTAAAPAAAPLDVTFLGSGRTLAWDGSDRNLLEFAERNGLAMESGCRSGTCGSCETRIVSGEVGYEANPGYQPAPGHCLPCVGRPASALVIQA